VEQGLQCIRRRTPFSRLFCSTNEEKRGNLCTIKKQLCAPNGALLRNSLKCETPITLGGILFYIRVYKQKKESFFGGRRV